MDDRPKVLSSLPNWLKSKVTQGILTLILWLASAGFSLYTLLEAQQMGFRLYIQCCSDNRWGFYVFQQWSSIIIIIFWLAFTVFTGEYHYQHVSERKSWRLLGWSYAGIFLLFLMTFIA